MSLFILLPQCTAGCNLLLRSLMATTTIHLVLPVVRMSCAIEERGLKKTYTDRILSYCEEVYSGFAAAHNQISAAC